MTICAQQQFPRYGFLSFGQSQHRIYLVFWISSKYFASSHNYEKFQEFKTNNLKACDETRSKETSFFERTYTVPAFLGKF
jgi:hypothetical protein